MAGISLVNGRLPAELVNNAAFVKYVGGGTEDRVSSDGVTGAKVHGTNLSFQAKEQELTQVFRAGQVDVVDLSAYVTERSTSAVAERDGKTVIDNRYSCGLIVETRDPRVTTPDDANSAAAKGAPTHGFFYHTTDFLLDAAEEYAALGENEVFMYRHINDVNFVRDTLDFFTNGNYTTNDVNAVQDQMTDIVYELAQQIKDGGSADVSKVQTTLTIGGTDVTMGQLLEMQRVGRELSESFSGITSGSLTAHNTEGFAKMGLAKSLGNYYGSDKGEIGTMFSDAMDRLYEKGVAQVEKTEAWAQTVSRCANTPSSKDAVKLELNIADLFSNLDTSSKRGLTQSFSSTLSQMRSLVQQYCSLYQFQTSHVGLASATDGLMKQFQTWMDQL